MRAAHFRYAWSAVAQIALLTTLTAQAPSSPTFDVVSIKPNRAGTAGGFSGSGGRWTMINIPIGSLIRTAYTSVTGELLRAPAWVESDPYDVDARAEVEPTPEQERMMLRALLADRFKFAAHYETQERPIYNLVVARTDGRLGPQLHHIDIDCATYKGQPAQPEASPSAAVDVLPCSFSISAASGASIVSGGRTLQSLADSIRNFAGRPISDRTGLTGYYAFTLEVGGPNDGVTIFTALQEQLGLKLESARGPIDMLVIDHIERPTEN